MELPLYRSVAVGYDSYLLDAEMQDLLPDASRSWRFNAKVRSMQLHGGYMKTLSGFGDHAHNEWDFLDLMDHCYARGVTRPSSYSSLFHALVKSPSIKWSFNGPFVEWFAGGWEEARVLGEHHDRLYQYDINSAYLWSLTQGLPNPWTFRSHKHPRPERSDTVGFIRPGLYVVGLECGTPGLPYPFNIPQSRYLASTQEIETYDLPVTKYHFGVTWNWDLWSTSYMTDAIFSFPCAKQISRSYWGRWASAAKLECHTPSKMWTMRNPVLNIIWAHIILSRVKLKIFTEISYPKHVYVDSVITEEPLSSTGTEVGEWRLIAEYDKGLNIAGPGIYGEIGKPFLKHIGQKRN